MTTPLSRSRRTLSLIGYAIWIPVASLTARSFPFLPSIEVGRGRLPVSHVGEDSIVNERVVDRH